MIGFVRRVEDRLTVAIGSPVDSIRIFPQKQTPMAILDYGLGNEMVLCCGMQWESLLMKKLYSFHEDIINIYEGHKSRSLSRAQLLGRGLVSPNLGIRNQTQFVIIVDTSMDNTNSRLRRIYKLH